MIKRILAALGGERKSNGPLAWTIQLCNSLEASVSVLPVLDVNAWKQTLPTMISANRAANLLDSEPWTQPENTEDALRAYCCHALTQHKIKCNMLPVESDPLGELASRSRYHDLLVFGLGNCYSRALVPDFTKAVSRLIVNGGCPLLMVPPEEQPVKKVLIAYSGTVASGRSFTRFLQSELFSDASVDVVTLSDSLEHAGSILDPAKEYLELHGRTVNLTALRGRESVLVDYALENGADLIVAGSNHRNLLGIETSSQALRAFLAQDKVAVFISH